MLSLMKIWFTTVLLNLLLFTIPSPSGQFRRDGWDNYFLSWLCFSWCWGVSILHCDQTPRLSSSDVYIAVNLLSSRNSEHLPPVRKTPEGWWGGGAGGPFVCLFISSVLAPERCWRKDRSWGSYNNLLNCFPPSVSQYISYSWHVEDVEDRFRHFGWKIKKRLAGGGVGALTGWEGGRGQKSS